MILKLYKKKEIFWDILVKTEKNLQHFVGNKPNFLLFFKYELYQIPCVYVDHGFSIKRFRVYNMLLKTKITYT